MKKSLFLLSAISLLLTGLANAQIPDPLMLARIDSKVHHSGNRSVGFLNDVDVKAVRHFKTAFAEASNERWLVTGQGYRVQFTNDSVRYIVDYEKGGQWRNTLKIYGEDKLPPNVRRTVLSTFFDFKIVTVTELDYRKTPAYFIKLEDKRTLKTVRVMHEEMEVVEEYKK